MAQGDPRTTGYPQGTPDTYLGSREATRLGPGSVAVNIQETTHGMGSAPIPGRKTIVTANTAVALIASATLARRVLVQLLEGSVGTVSVGNSAVVNTLASRTGFTLITPGDFVEMDIVDLNAIFINGANVGDGVSFLYWTL